jgi:cytidine deaminase
MDATETTPDALCAADRALLDAAECTRGRARAAYSGFPVGAAARSRDGRVYTGANLESASYGVSLCAEVGALQAALAAGDFEIEAIAVVGGLRDGPAGGPVTPCGRCRQLILEAAQVAGTNVRVLCANVGLSQVLVTDIETLLPHGFGPKDLKS